jgi:hypothetical protein
LEVVILMENKRSTDLIGRVFYSGPSILKNHSGIKVIAVGPVTYGAPSFIVNKEIKEEKVIKSDNNIRRIKIDEREE